VAPARIDIWHGSGAFLFAAVALYTPFRHKGFRPGIGSSPLAWIGSQKYLYWRLRGPQIDLAAGDSQHKYALSYDYQLFLL
jgi:hypothetical protein